VLFIDRSERLWIGSEQGLGYFDGSRFLALPSDVFPKAPVYGVAEDNESGMWIASRAGLHRYFRGRVQQLLPGHGGAVVSIAPVLLLAAVARAEAEPALLYRVRAAGGQWSTDLLPGMQSSGDLTVDAAGAALYPCDAQAWCELAADSLRRWEAGPLPVTRHPYIGHAGDLPVWTVLRDRFGCVYDGTFP
jgi:hypothetical protein